MVKLQDIADSLGITKSTVSKALSGATDVSDETRERVQQTASELGYKGRAKSAKEKKEARSSEQSVRVKGHVAVCVSNMAHISPSDMGSMIYAGFQTAAEKNGYIAHLIDTPVSQQKLSDYDRFMRSNEFDGAMLLGFSLNDPWTKNLKTSNVPAALFDMRIMDNTSTTYVGMDNEEAFMVAVKRLKQLGHSRIGYLSGAMGSFIFQTRYSAFFKALEKNKLDSSRTLAGNSYYYTECLTKHLPRLLKQGVTAVMCSSDQLANSLLMYCAQSGIKVPDDLSVVGFDDLPISAFTSPALTTIHQSFNAIGETGFVSLMYHFRGIPVSSILLRPTLVERASTAPPPQAG